jgi:hypothetical protein
VTETRFGSFTVELDSQYAHPDDNDDDAAASSWDDIGRAVRDGLTTAIATVTRLWLPIEIVSPPVPLAVLPELDSLVPALRGRGAAGCSDGLVYAFATQLNPEVPSLRAESMLAHLKAFLLLAQRLQRDLRLQCRIDLPSRLLHHPLRLSRRSRPRSNQADGPKIGVHF